MEERFLLYNLGRIPWWQTQAIYAALARLGQRAVVLCEPDQPFFCLGYHQDAQAVLNVEYLKALGIPFIRREIGGGLVYLHPGQPFYQVILPKSSHFFTMNRRRFYQQFLEPVAGALRDLGLPAQYVPVADLWLRGRKISGNGAGEIGSGVAFSGNVLLDFDAAGFLNGLAYASPLHRQVVEDKVLKHVGHPHLAELDYGIVAQALSRRFAELLGPLQAAEVDQQLEKEMFKVKEAYLDLDYLEKRRGPRSRINSLKVAERVDVDQAKIIRTGLAWDVVGVWIHKAYTERYIERWGC